MEEVSFPNSKVFECIEECTSQLPSQYQKCPWTHPELHNGCAILNTIEGMNCYMAAYGEMHYVKCLTSMQNFPYETLQGNIEIVDWGCGQGIGSMTIIENLENHDLLHNLHKVTLIEPSSKTIGRASEFVKRMVGSGVQIEAINKYIPVKNSSGNAIESLSYQYGNVIHIFSNILDVADFDFAKIAEIVVSQGKNAYILCVGPMNFYSYRIDQLCSIFDNPQYFSFISEKAFRRTSKSFKMYGCKTRCFRVPQSALSIENFENFVIPTLVGDSPILDEYDPRYVVECGLISKQMGQLSEIISHVISPEDIFYLKPNILGDSMDALVVSRKNGILLIKLWDDNINNYVFAEATNDKGDVEIDYKHLRKKVEDGSDVIPTPLAIMDAVQLDLAKHHLPELLEVIASDFKKIDFIKKVIVFGQNTSDEAREFFKNHWNYNTLLGTDLFSDKIKQSRFVQTCYFDKEEPTFDDRLMHRFLHHLSPKWHSYKEGRPVNLTSVQNKLSESREKARQKISGVAGSGKTQVLCQRAVNAQKRTGGKILILSYNITLANYLYYRLDEICADFPWEKFRVSHYHEFFKQEANNCGLHADFSSYDNGHFFDGKVADHQKYDAIFIDEAQDYKTEWLSNITKFLAPNAEFVLFGDSTQNIFNRATDKYGDVLFGEGSLVGGVWNKDLKKSMRIANPRLTSLANTFKEQWICNSDLMETTGKEQSLFFEMQYEYWQGIPSAEILEKKIREIIADMKFDLKDTVVLAQIQSILSEIDYIYRGNTQSETSITFASKEEVDKLRDLHHIDHNGYATYRFSIDVRSKERNKKLAFSMDSRKLKFSTIHSFKGWEANNVILILLPVASGQTEEQYVVSSEQNAPSLIYTAITRAKDNLYILNCGNKTYNEFFEKNMNAI